LFSFLKNEKYYCPKPEINLNLLKIHPIYRIIMNKPIILDHSIFFDGPLYEPPIDTSGQQIPPIRAYIQETQVTAAEIRNVQQDTVGPLAPFFKLALCNASVLIFTVRGLGHGDSAKVAELPQIFTTP
jgi:hypothetical protein